MTTDNGSNDETSAVVTGSDDLPEKEQALCLNCGTPLRGQYCGHCGQRSRSRLISIWQLLREAFGDLLELDSRLWRTLLPLLLRPGQLTRDYLEGRRARYMPPFRMYLVLSLMFFVIAFFDPKDDLSLLFEPEPPPTAEETAREEPEQEGGRLFRNCETASLAEQDLPLWVKKRFTDERVQQICKRNKARGVENIPDAMIDNLPVALIVLLPLMALVLKLLYPLSRRYFVEHLLFFIHFHAFVFLVLTLEVVFAGIVGLVSSDNGTVESIKSLILVIASFYVPVYLYKAMRHVYGQTHIVTIVKYLLLLTAYLAGTTVSMLGIFLAALMSA